MFSIHCCIRFLINILLFEFGMVTLRVNFLQNRVLPKYSVLMRASLLPKADTRARNKPQSYNFFSIIATSTLNLCYKTCHKLHFATLRLQTTHINVPRIVYQTNHSGKSCSASSRTTASPPLRDITCMPGMFSTFRQASLGQAAYPTADNIS